MPFSVFKFQKHICPYTMKDFIKLLVPLTARGLGGEVKVLAESFANNARFFLRLPYRAITLTVSQDLEKKN